MSLSSEGLLMDAAGGTAAAAPPLAGCGGKSSSDEEEEEEESRALYWEPDPTGVTTGTFTQKTVLDAQKHFWHPSGGNVV